MEEDRRQAAKFFPKPHNQKSIKIECLTCKGTGKVEILESFEDNDKEAPCPDCNPNHIA
jgi:DnaJ-class molecular chaperone